MYTSISPSQNTGSDTPVSATAIPIRSKMELGCAAERSPIGIPTRRATVIAPSESSIVAGNLGKNSTMTLRWVSSESPKSPLTACHR